MLQFEAPSAQSAFLSLTEDSPAMMINIIDIMHLELLKEGTGLSARDYLDQVEVKRRN